MANILKVNIKWGKEKYTDVELNLDQDVLTFKSQIYALTNVLVDKQKLMSKGKIIQDGGDIKSFKLKNGSNLLLMGTAENTEVQKSEEKQFVFLEDLTQEEIAKIYQEETGEALPCGLVNLGNTCYLNSVIQNLRRVNELKRGLVEYNGELASANLAEQYTVAAKRLFESLDNSGDAVTPFEFVNVVRKLFPLFAAQDKNGFKQQDADEYLNTVLQTLNDSVKYTDPEGTEHKLINYLFNVEIEVRYKNLENDEEAPEVKLENSNKMICHINSQVNHLHEGLKLSLEEDLTKYSETLGRDAVYRKTQRVNKLPPYLVVQFMRFDWKKKSEAAGTEATKTKILRNVSFPKCLDIHELCSESLQDSLKFGRDFIVKRKERELEKLQKAQEETKKNEGPTKKKTKEPVIEGATDEILYKEHGTGLDAGNYQLISVVTHKGRSADSGHYVGWVHKKGDEWLEYDDDVVRLRKTEDIMNLRGGGDWHMSYICIYRKVETHNEEEGEKMEQD